MKPIDLTKQIETIEEFQEIYNESFRRIMLYGYVEFKKNKEIETIKIPKNL